MKRRFFLALAGTVAVTLTACSVDQVSKFLSRNDPPPRPGRESVAGAHLVYDKDKEGNWTAERKYSKEQEEQGSADIVQSAYQVSWPY